MANKKKKQSDPDSNLIDFDLYFDDLTMLQTDGVYARVCEVMDQDQDGITVIKAGRPVVLPKNNITGSEWCIKSSLTIYSPFGKGDILLDFHKNGDVFVIGFASTNMDKYQNMDVRCLTAWCQQNGWKIPQVSPAVARTDVKFWKHMWDALIIDSQFFDDKYGKRKSLEMREETEEEQEDV